MSNLINEKQAAEKIGLSVHWLRRKRWSGGGIPYVKVSTGGAVRYRSEDIDAYVSRRVQELTNHKQTTLTPLNLSEDIVMALRQSAK